MNFLAGIGLKAWGYLATALAVVAGLFVAMGKAKQAGRNEVVSKVSEATSKAQERMLDAAVQAPRSQADVVKDLRSGKF